MPLIGRVGSLSPQSVNWIATLADTVGRQEFVSADEGGNASLEGDIPSDAILFPVHLTKSMKLSKTCGI